MLPLNKKIMRICPIIATLPLLFNSSASAENIPTQNSQITITHDVAPWLKSGLLNSVRIELKFGSCGVQVLAQDTISASATRLSSLYSLHKGEKITRTLAFTQYVDEIDDQLKVAHEEIVAGGLIGATLKKHGFELKKNLFFKGLVKDMPIQVQTLMHTKENIFAAVSYNLSAKSEKGYLPYCTIVEIYALEFMTLKEVDLIYPELTSEKMGQVDYILNRMKDSINNM